MWIKSLASIISLGDVLKRNNGQGPSFGLVRIALAGLIFYGHCFWVAGSALSGVAGTPGDATHERWVPLVWQGQTQIRLMLVPMFFAVSGFLVTGSAFRTQSLKTFLVFRVLRIVPALFTEVSLSALFLGPLLTVVSLRDYFSDHRFFEYFGNIVGRVRMILPGLFLDNPATAAVNVNLWTLPAEFYCYLIVALLLAAGLLANRIMFTIVFVLATVGFFIVSRFGDPAFVESILNDELSNVLIVYYFFCGCLIYHWREFIPFNFLLFSVAALLSYFLYVFKEFYIAPLLVSYVIIFIGMVKFPKVRLIESGDYSYGVYLYGFPIAQAVIFLLPQFRGHGWLVLFVAGPLTFCFAALSWHALERPALSLKKLFAVRKPAAVAG
jgi:peptidoglycan/LPS O-acetylase OafA/YrhL